MFSLLDSLFWKLCNIVLFNSWPRILVKVATSYSWLLMWLIIFVLCKGTQYIHYFIHQSTPQPPRAYCGIPGDITVRITKEWGDCHRCTDTCCGFQRGGGLVSTLGFGGASTRRHIYWRPSAFFRGQPEHSQNGFSRKFALQTWPQLTTYGYIEVVHYRALTSSLHRDLSTQVFP